MHHKANARSTSSTILGAEKRREPRLATDGLVRIVIEDQEHLAIEGQLVDVSASGFRVSHSSATLSKGQLVRFEHPTARGCSKVIWNRITTEIVETGFLIV